jgi:hypothetical protein
MVDQRINRIGAMGTAMMNMAVSANGPQYSRGRMAVGVGFQNGESARSVGWGKQIGKTGNFSLGAAFSGNDTSAGVGFGFAL